MRNGLAIRVLTTNVQILWYFRRVRARFSPRNSRSSAWTRDLLAQVGNATRRRGMFAARRQGSGKTESSRVSARGSRVFLPEKRPSCFGGTPVGQPLRNLPTLASVPPALAHLAFLCEFREPRPCAKPQAALESCLAEDNQPNGADRDCYVTARLMAGRVLRLTDLGIGEPSRP
jgi:hypothetical protein